MDYLQCNMCHQRYELLPDEKPEDFNLNCGCGGHLEKRLDDDEQFLLERNLGYKINSTYTSDEVIHGIVRLFKIGFFLLLVFSNILMLIIFLPLGLLMLLGTYGIYKIFFK